ncbi:MAG: metal ABC transporter permease, partial [Beijerinckiaceae bacterium]
MELLLEPFAYGYMARAIWMSALVAAVCAFLSCYLVLRGLALMGDALAHAVVPGVAVAYLLGLPYALGAFVSGLVAAGGIYVVRRITALKEDAVIGVIFTAMFAAGLLLISINPVAVNLQSVIMGNILAIDDDDAMQVVLISAVVLAALGLRWKDLMLAFFDPAHARVVGLDPQRLMLFFFALMSA